MTKYYYTTYCNEIESASSRDFQDCYEIESDRRIDDERDLEWLAEDCAEDYYHNQDGWEGWENGDVIGFVIYDDSEKLLGSFEVELELRASFIASLNKDKS